MDVTDERELLESLALIPEHASEQREWLGMEGSGGDGGIGRRWRGENQTHDPQSKRHSLVHAKQAGLFAFYFIFFSKWVVMVVEMFL